MNCAVVFYSAVLLFGFIQSVPIVKNDLDEPSDKEDKPCKENDTVQCKANSEATLEEPHVQYATEETQPASFETEREADPEYLHDHDEYETYMVQAPSYVIQPDSIPKPPRVSYQVDPHLRAGRFDHRNFIHPYMYSRYFGANRLSQVNTLPQVFTTQIHGLTPYLDQELEQSRYDVGELDPGTTELMPRNLRLQRMSQMREDNPFEDLLKELDFAGIMPNILPTMNIPFLRDAGYEVPQGYGQSYAVFPRGAGGCAQPILLSCSPEQIGGTLLKEYRKGPLSAPVYRQNPEHIHASHGANIH